MIETLPDEVEAAVLDWRCGNCGSRLQLLGRYTDLGGVYVRKPLRSRHHRTERCLALLIDLAGGRVATRCGTCLDWRQLRYEQATGKVRESAWDGYVPA